MLEEQVDLRFVSYIIQSEKAASLILITTKVTYVCFTSVRVYRNRLFLDVSSRMQVNITGKNFFLYISVTCRNVIMSSAHKL